MDAEDLELFERSLRAATERHTGADLDAALLELGWREALAEDPRAAVSLLFALQGRATATSSALDWVLLDALGLDGDVAVVMDRGRVTIADANPADVDGWPAAVAAAQVALGHELVGVSRTMLGQAREHALEREQFGQPIAMFQAIRHRLAETLIAIETAEAVLDAAWLDGTPTTAAMAKALAGRGARTAARHCQQVLAGIGFTTEHDFHRSFRRVLVLDELFGSSRTLTRSLGEQLLDTRQLPPLLPL